MLKKITEMSTLKQGIGAFGIFLILTLILPIFNAPDSTEAAFAASTFIFAILAGFFISRLSTRYSAVGKATSDEDSWWSVIYGNSKCFDTTIQDELVELIDEYYVIIYDRDLTQNYVAGTPVVNKIYDLLASLKDQNLTTVQMNALDNMLDALAEVEIVRNEAQTVGFEKMTSGMWAVTVALLLVVVGSMFLLRDGSLIFNIAVAVFSAGGVIVLLLMRDLDDFKIGEFMLAEESGQQIFELIGKPRYYHEKYLSESDLVKIPPYVKEYRVGRHVVGDEPKFEMVPNRNYDPNFKI